MAQSINSQITSIEQLDAKSRTTTGGISSGATYASAAGIDLTTIGGTIQILVSAGTVATSLDLKFQESADNTTFTDVSHGSNNSITQVTTAPANGTLVPVLEKSVRDFTKRYARILATVGGTCVFSVIAIVQPWSK